MVRESWQCDADQRDGDGEEQKQLDAHRPPSLAIHVSIDTVGVSVDLVCERHLAHQCEYPRQASKRLLRLCLGRRFDPGGEDARGLRFPDVRSPLVPFDCTMVSAILWYRAPGGPAAPPDRCRSAGNRRRAASHPREREARERPPAHPLRAANRLESRRQRVIGGDFVVPAGADQALSR